MRSSSGLSALLVVGAALPAVAQSDGAPSTLRGRVIVEVATCCGGAVRDPDAECSTHEPYVGEVVARVGRANRGRVVARATTDDGGAFRLTLAPGTYCIAVGDRVSGWAEGGMAATSGTECMSAYLRACDAIVTVPRDGRLTVRTDRPCFGRCYDGPYPG